MATEKDSRRAIVARELPLRAAEMQARQRNQEQLALAAFRGLTIVNGGAIVALFTFIGNDSQVFDAHMAWWGFSFFVAGIALVLAATLLAYFAEGYYADLQFQQVWWAHAVLNDRDPSYSEEKGKRVRRIGDILNYSSLCFAVLSLLSFVAGAACVLSGVLTD